MKKVKIITTLCLIIIICTNSLVWADINVNEGIKGALLGDLDTGEVLYEYNINEQLPIGSISKLVTYLLMMEAVEAGQISLDDDVTISGHAAATEGSRFGLAAGEVVKLETLAQAILVVSGNDAATAVAEHVAKTEDNFVKMMNEKFAELGLMSASFINPHGLPINDEITGQNHMSISDIYKLSRYILTKYPEVVEITSKRELVVPERNFRKSSTNQVLKVMDSVDGLKTGYTDAAGLCLVTTMPVISDNGRDFRLIAIVMGAQNEDDRVSKSTQLLEHGRDNYSMQKLSDMNTFIDNVYISSSAKGKVEVYPSKDLLKLVENNKTVKTSITYNDKVSAPIAKGEKIGTITIYIDDKEIEQIDAVVNENIEKANIFVRIFRFFKGLFGF